MLTFSYTCGVFNSLRCDRWEPKTRVPEGKEKRKCLKATNSCPVSAFSSTREGIAPLPGTSAGGAWSRVRKLWRTMEPLLPFGALRRPRPRGCSPAAAPPQGRGQPRRRLHEAAAAPHPPCQPRPSAHQPVDLHLLDGRVARGGGLAFAFGGAETAAGSAGAFLARRHLSPRTGRKEKNETPEAAATARGETAPGGNTTEGGSGRMRAAATPLPPPPTPSPRRDGGGPSRPPAISGRDGVALARPRQPARPPQAQPEEEEEPCSLRKAAVAIATQPAWDGRGAERPRLSTCLSTWRPATDKPFLGTSGGAFPWLPWVIPMLTAM